MRERLGTRIFTAAVLAVTASAVLAACGGDSGDSGSGAGAAAAAGTAVTTSDSDLGQIVVDGAGMTVYYYTPDKPGSGKSACTGECLAAWPPVHSDAATPKGQGVTGDLGTIKGNDGKLQVTLDGHPLYLYAGDHVAGDVNGQGIQGIWWVVSPDGKQVTAPPATPNGGGY